MELSPYLVFSFHNALYGINALLVKEIFYLPELTPVIEAPPDIVGMVNLRGKILPVMDLDRRLGNSAQPDYQLSDSVIVLEWQGLSLGMIVSQVHEVKLIAPEMMETQLTYGRTHEARSQFVSGIAKVGTDLITLFNYENLLRYSESVAALVGDLPPEGLGSANGNGDGTSSHTRLFCPNATPEDRAIFRDRAENLMRSTDNQDFTGLVPLAIIGLNGEYFGFDLDVVREFTDIRKITPVPCCPNHIVGNMNLRGEIVTLIDIRGALNMPTVAMGAAAKAMVVHVNDLVAGIAVDQVFDVMYLRPSEVRPIPTAVHSEADDCLRGTAAYQEKMMSIVDISKILQRKELIVNEEA